MFSSKSSNESTSDDSSNDSNYFDLSYKARLERIQYYNFSYFQSSTPFLIHSPDKELECFNDFFEQIQNDELIMDDLFPLPTQEQIELVRALAPAIKEDLNNMVKTNHAPVIHFYNHVCKLGNENIMDAFIREIKNFCYGDKYINHLPNTHQWFMDHVLSTAPTNSDAQSRVTRK